VQESLERVEDLGADAECLRERIRARRHDHELLEVEGVLRVGAAVHDVHQRYGENAGSLPAEPGVERLAGLRSSRLRDGEGRAEHRVRAQPFLVRRPVQVDQRPVDLGLL
jgi:hypothetical protein